MQTPPPFPLESYCSCIIGAHSYIGHGADFMGITLEKVSIRHPAQICAILGNMTNIAGGIMTSNWRFDNGVREQRTGKHREKPEKYGELTFLGDHVRTGSYSQRMGPERFGW